MDLQRLQSRSSFVVAKQSSVVRAAFLMGICTAAAVISAVDTAQAQQGAFVYATRGNEDAVSVIDTITDTVPTTYAVGVSPVAVVLTENSVLARRARSGRLSRNDRVPEPVPPHPCLTV